MATNFEELKRRLDAQKSRRDKAQGTIESIKKHWLEEYGTDDPEQIKKLLEEAKHDLAELDKEYTETISKAEALISQAEGVR